MPVLREWRTLKPTELTRAEKIMYFCENFCVVPEGRLVGQPIKLAAFQEKFIYAVYDNPAVTRHAYLSIARKNAKTGTIAMLLLAHLVGPERVRNSQIVSGALSREQAAMVYNLAAQMVQQSPKLLKIVRCVDSTKRIKALSPDNASMYKALAADGKTAHGLSPRLAILDETGQVIGPHSAFIDAITSSQGAHENPLLIIISTQAANDADLLSRLLDDAKSSQDPHTVAHVYAADPGCSLMDEDQWLKANPALDLFRGRKDLSEQLLKASRMPTQEASARNLLLNQRISQKTVWIPPSVWKENTRPVNLELFDSRVIHLGLDLSMRNDLTACVASVKDDEGFVHIMPLVFVPEANLRERELRDKAPYMAWVDQGLMYAVPGRVIDYEWVATFLREKFGHAVVGSLQFDRWGIEHFKQSCASVGFEAPIDWVPVGQGYKDFSPRLKAFEVALLKGYICHSNHPLLNMAVANAIAVNDPSGNIKLDKSASSMRIDPLIAAVMAAFPLLDGQKDNLFDISRMIA